MKKRIKPLSEEEAKKKRKELIKDWKK